MNTWYNHKTREYENFDGLPPEERLKEFISQNNNAQILYDIYILQGKTPEESFESVLENGSELPTK